MFKTFIFSVLALLSYSVASAQLYYNFKTTTATYTPLTGATSLNGSTIWDEEDMTAPMPFSWKLDSTITQNNFKLALWFSSVLADPNDTLNINGFSLGDMDIADRSTFSATAPSSSPIRYLTTGAAPFRIFKLELANAGFYSEGDVYGTMNDSFNVQIWIYETTNIVEFHYGGAKVSHPSDYFNFGNGPLTGYYSHFDVTSFNSGNLYTLSGSPAAPNLDSIDISTGFPSAALNSWPANGTVYRFVPKGVCEVPQASFTAGTPSGKTVQYTYSGSTPVDSVRWNFGDGNTSTAMNPSHTFAANGHYNVCVTAYTKCGSNSSCKALALSVGNLAALGDVKVYPNPANNYLIVEGMQAGSRASIISMIGQEVLPVGISEKQQHIDIASLPAGTYRLVLTDKNGNKGSVQFSKQ